MRAAPAEGLLRRRPVRSSALAALGLGTAALASGYAAAALALAAASVARAGAAMGPARLNLGGVQAVAVGALILAGSLTPRVVARLRRRSRQMRGRTVVRVARLADADEGREERVAVGRGGGPWTLGRAGAPGVDAALPTGAAGAVARLTRLRRGWQVEALGPHHVYGEDGMPRRSMRLNGDGWVRVADVRLGLGLRGGGVRARRGGAGPGRGAAAVMGPTRATRRRGRLRVERADGGGPVADRVVRAEGPLGRAWGLLGRRALDPGEGLWIEPCNAVHALGMRMALDVVYLAADGEVLAVVAPLRPWRVGPVVARARAVVELAPGTVARLGIRVGDRLTAAPV